MSIFIMVGFLIFFYMTGVFIIATLKKDNSIIDIAWGFGFILIALFSIAYTGFYTLRHDIVTTLVALWGIRLSGYIALRTWGKGEDPRYVVWRKTWGKFVVIRSFFQIFMLQGLVMWIVALPIVIVNTSADTSLGMLDFLGIFVWGVGFFFETVDDYQLYWFLRSPYNQNHIMDQGLWRYTRHPNYFGESLIWWGMWIIACAVPYGYLTVVSPIMITAMLLFVSGIPLAEKPFAQNVAYQLYVRRTSAFIPWFVKRG